MCSEISSPRLSFSHDLSETDDFPIKHEDCRRDTMLLDSSSDFEFSISRSLEEDQSCSADELFFNGVILPIRGKMAFQKKITHNCELANSSLLPPLPCSSNNMKKGRNKQAIEVNSSSNDHKKASQQGKSFWGFKRSKSLNFDTRRSLLCSLPLLSRSKSTGSVSNPKKMSLKDTHKQNSHKKPLLSQSSSSSSSGLNLYQVQQKPPLNKSYGGSHGNGVRISPVLNVPPPYISKGTASLFGFGSFLSGGKEKIKK